MRTAFFIRASLVSKSRRTGVRNRSVLRLESSERGKCFRVEMLLCEIRRKVNREFRYVSARTFRAPVVYNPSQPKNRKSSAHANPNGGEPTSFGRAPGCHLLSPGCPARTATG